MSYAIPIILCVLISTTYIESSRILTVFPTPAVSHQAVYRTLISELHKRGHDIVSITPNPIYPKGETPQNLTEIDVHDVSYELWKGYITEHLKGSEHNQIEHIITILEFGSKIFEEQLKNTEVQNILNNENEKYDLIFTEQWIRPTIAFSYLFDVPVITMNSFGGINGLFEEMGAESHPFLYPLCSEKRIYNLTVWEKIIKLYVRYFIGVSMSNLVIEDNKMLQKYFGPNIPSITELEKNIDLVFLNIYDIWDANRPVPPNVVYLGGLHRQPEKDLPQDLKSYLDSSKKGVIYVSFGSNVRPSQLPSEKIKLLMKVLSQLPYNVLWKWDKDELPAQYPNIKFSKWFPQSDLLKHPNIKVFITQGGLQSLDESIAAGVPLIVFPIFGDQFYNAEKYVHHEIGAHLTLETVTEDTFRNTVLKVINDESYRQNVIKTRTIMYDHPQSSLERAVWWTEYVLRHKGAKHLRAAAYGVPWFQYYEIKLIIMILLLTVLFIMLFIKTLQYIIREYVQQKIKIN